MGRRPWFPYTLEQQVERKCLNSIAVRLFDLIGDQTENGMNPKFHTHRKKIGFGLSALLLFGLRPISQATSKPNTSLSAPWSLELQT
jgi:hypothetical protein